MISGSADHDEIERTVADELLGKPCSSTVLKATLERMMNRSPA